MNQSIKFGLLSLVIFFITVSNSFPDRISGILITSSLIIAVAGIILAIKSISKNKSRTLYLGSLVCVTALVIILGIMMYGHFILYGKIGILNFNK